VLGAAALGLASKLIRPTRAYAHVTQAERVITDLGIEFDGYTIVALADFHHRHPWTDVRWLRHAIDATNSVSPDLVVLLGDYGSSFKQAPTISRRWYGEALTAMSPEFRRLSGSDGVVAVLGNHDHYADARMVGAWLRDLGIDLLVNEPRCVMRSRSVLRIAGMDDAKEGSVSPRIGCKLESQPPTIVLSHNPDGIRQVDARLRIDAMLAGHTHGGQIVLPWLGAPVTMSRTCGRRTAHGWIENPRAPLFVTRGLGEQLPVPIRVACPPEILVVRLRRSPQQPA